MLVNTSLPYAPSCSQAIHQFLKSDPRLPPLATDSVAAEGAVAGPDGQVPHHVIRVRSAAGGSRGRQRAGAQDKSSQKRGKRGEGDTLLLGLRVSWLLLLLHHSGGSGCTAYVRHLPCHRPSCCSSSQLGGILAGRSLFLCVTQWPGRGLCINGRLPLLDQPAWALCHKAMWKHERV